MDQSEQEKALLDVLDRQTTYDALGALASTLQSNNNSISLAETAIGLDANVFLRLIAHKKAEDIIDYLISTHAAPLIILGQAIQEFWNNHLYAVDTIASTLRKKFDEFRVELEKLVPHHGSYIHPIKDALDLFREDHGHLFDEGIARKTLAFLDALQTRALVPHVSRSRFQAIAGQRKRTRTPPGFKDDSDGDFFIWVDFLSGLQASKGPRKAFRVPSLFRLIKNLTGAAPEWPIRF